MSEPPKIIRVVPYDRMWPRMFVAEKELLLGVFEEEGQMLEHIGSTSVPGLGAKPVIDIMAGVRSLANVERMIPRIEGLGYAYVPEYEAEIPGRRYFRKPRVRPRTHHLHVVELGTEFWESHLAFRDFLRERPEWAEEYYLLKRELAGRLRGDGRAYTEAKSDFVERVLGEVRA